MDWHEGAERWVGGRLVGKIYDVVEEYVLLADLGFFAHDQR